MLYVEIWMGYGTQMAFFNGKKEHIANESPALDAAADAAGASTLTIVVVCYG